MKPTPQEIRALRAAMTGPGRRMSRKALGELVGVGEHSVRMWELGVCGPNDQHFAALEPLLAQYREAIDALVAAWADKPCLQEV